VSINCWCDCCKNCVKTYVPNNEYISHEHIHAILITIVLIIILIYCFYKYPDTLKTIIVIKQEPRNFQ